MNEQNFKILNSLSLVEVMRGWGYVPKYETANGSLAWYLCPWHDDHRPSFSVEKDVRDGAHDLGFKCWAGRDGHQGFGAVQLAAQLMGLSPGLVPAEDMTRVLTELATRCDVELLPEDVSEPWKDDLRKSLIGWDDFKAGELQYADMKDGEARFEPGEWTEEGLKSLGLKVELSTRKATKGDLGGGTAGHTTAHPRNNDITLSRDNECQESEVRIGDLLTQYDPDTGEPLYRCSLGRDFYRGAKRAETKTIREWGELVQRTFGVQPVSRFLKRQRLEKGGVVVLTVKATKNYPMFIFQYPWGVKKYEPKDVYGRNKWTWYNVTADADLYHQWYADAALTDALEGAMPEQDEHHPFIEATMKDKDGNDIKGKDGQAVKKLLFERVVICSGPRDAIAVWSHSNAHVLWLHSEQAGFDSKGGNVRPNRWLRSLLKKLQGVTADGGLYICYDEDSTGLAASQAIALNNPNVRWLRLPKELTEIIIGGKAGEHTKHLKDVTDFVTRFADVEARMPADVQHDDPVEWFENVLFDTPSCKFWQWESERKEKDGTSRARYKFDLRNTPVFLRAKGMVRRVMQQGKVSFSRFFLLGNDRTYIELFPGEKGANKLVAQSRELMSEWLRAHKEYNDDKGALSRAIYSAKLEQGTMEGIEQVMFDEKSFGEDFDHFFFENTAVRVTKDTIETVGYSQMRWWTNRESIMEGRFSLLRQPWHVEVSGFFETERLKHEEIMQSLKTAEERAQENMRWDGWQSLWRYRLVMDKPIGQMPLHFRFLYHTSRIFWEKEQNGEELTKTERQVQDMYLMAMLHAIGSALVRHRSANRQQFLHITDNGTRREDLASGGTGKTAIMELLGLVRRVLKVDGKALEGGNIKLSQELDKVIPGLHSIVCLDELPQGFSPKTLYNYTLSLTSRGMYRESVVLEGDDLPKFVIASNEQIDLSSDSTSRRTYQLLVSDWYHPRSIDGSRPSHTPADDFRKEGIKEVARNLPPQLLNEARNLLLGCVQLFFQLPEETIMPPKDSRALLRQALAASKDEQFTRWIAGYLANKRHLGIPIAQRELAISLLDFCGITIGEKTMKAAYRRIGDNLDDYLRTSIYVCNPHVVLLTPTDRENHYRQCPSWQWPKGADGYSVALDNSGNRLPRELKPTKRVYYFYLKSRIPRHFYDPAHEGDNDYVQAAPSEDPDGIEE